MTNTPIKVAVITGEHRYDPPTFEHLFSTLTNTQCDIQTLEDFAKKQESTRDEYQVVVFYNMHTKTPCAYNGTEDQRIAIERLGETGQGILVLHHALLAFRGWDVWYDIVGFKLRNFNYTSFQKVDYKIADCNHPITKGIADYTMVDEVYEITETNEQSHPLITTDNPYSSHITAWTRKWRSSKVFCFQNGHCIDAYENENYQRLLTQGIAWLAQR